MKKRIGWTGLGALVLLASAGATAMTQAPDGQEAGYAAMEDMVGDWKGSAKAYIAPGLPPESSGAEVSTAQIGSYWLAQHVNVEAFGDQVQHLYLIGINPDASLTGTLVSSGSEVAYPLSGHYDRVADAWVLSHDARSLGGQVIPARTTIRIDARKGTQRLEVHHLLGEGYETVALDVQLKRGRAR